VTSLVCPMNPKAKVALACHSRSVCPFIVLSLTYLGALRNMLEAVGQFLFKQLFVVCIGFAVRT
jgi:hypothetical protein